MKDNEFKEYWDKRIGCSYIPHWALNDRNGKIDPNVMSEGGQIDEDTIPDWLKVKGMKHHK